MPENFARIYNEKKDNNEIEPYIIKLLDKHFNLNVKNILKNDDYFSLAEYLSNLCDDVETVTSFLEYLISLENDELVQAFLWNDVTPDFEMIKSEKIIEYFKIVEDAKNSPKKPRNITKKHNFEKGYLLPLNENDLKTIIKEAEKENFKDIDDLRSSLASFDEDDCNYLSIFNKDNQLVGFIGLAHLEQGYYKYNIVFYLIPRFRKQNYMYLAAKAVIELAFDKQLLVLEDDPYFNYKYTGECLIVRLIYASVENSDDRTNSLLKKLGFTFDGVEKFIDKELNTHKLNVYTLPTNTKNII